MFSSNLSTKHRTCRWSLGHHTRSRKLRHFSSYSKWWWYRCWYHDTLSADWQRLRWIAYLFFKNLRSTCKSWLFDQLKKWICQSLSLVYISRWPEFGFHYRFKRTFRTHNRSRWLWTNVCKLVVLVMWSIV